MLRAEVGDTIEVLLVNRMRYPVSMHPHGVRYMKDSEGAPYNDGTSGAADGTKGAFKCYNPLIDLCTTRLAIPTTQVLPQQRDGA